jgi:protein-disulfide isomerase-like protein with CxxC motif
LKNYSAIRNTMTDLSPAAQAVLDAMHEVNMDFDGENAILAAAALRAAADRTMSLIGDVCHPKFMEGIEAASDFLEQIAAELDLSTTEAND